MAISNLEERLIQFAIHVIQLSNSLNSTDASLIMRRQLIRSATSTALNYGEARSAQSSRDFLHKNRIVLKELRESYVAMIIIKRAGLCKAEMIDNLLEECNQLVAIFVKSVKTTEGKLKNQSS